MYGSQRLCQLLHHSFSAALGICLTGEGHFPRRRVGESQACYQVPDGWARVKTHTPCAGQTRGAFTTSSRVSPHQQETSEQPKQDCRAGLSQTLNKRKTEADTERTGC